MDDFEMIKALYSQLVYFQCWVNAVVRGVTRVKIFWRKLFVIEEMDKSMLVWDDFDEIFNSFEIFVGGNATILWQVANRLMGMLGISAIFLLILVAVLSQLIGLLLIICVSFVYLSKFIRISEYGKFRTNW